MDYAVPMPTRLPFSAVAATMPRVSALESTDEVLLARVAEGDRDAFGDLYQR